jgi:hypothetical protein
MAGTFVELSDSVGDVDTSDQLDMFEAFGKIMVVNGANLKVADFINTKLTHTTLTTAHAHGDVITQATTGAQMIVDFTDSTKTHTYGFVSNGTFDTAHTVSGSGSGTSFTPSAVASNPHWYDWTVYPGGTSGAMPEKAYLGCLYRGRCVLSGNPNYPYQWYMSRQANPWDWAYTANDAQSPVAGQDADAGEMGDIITALIPYSDEYLIFGCINSIWVLKGDPAEGGTLQEVDLTKGIFGARSWCFDGDRNLYFASSSGIHVLPVGFNPIKNITKSVLPNIFTDLSVNSDTHRVLLGYDPIRDGVLITITTLATGANICYYYDIAKKGFFPESYPDSCGVYSMFYYNAVDPTYSGLLLGSTDGFIRTHDDSSKNDESTNSSVAIDANVLLPIIETPDNTNKVKLVSTTVVLSGGASSGTYSDSNSATIEVYTGNSAEEVLESFNDGDTPLQSDVVTGPGKANRIRNRATGNAIAINIKNNTAGESFSIENIAGHLEEVERY